MPDLRSPLRGRAWCVGDSIDTDQLLGAGGAKIVGFEELKQYCLKALRPEFSEEVQVGDILVAGHNFGCGSSRQTAVQALQASGISVVLAESVARIFRRNGIALALPIFIVPGIAGAVADGDSLEVDYPAGVVRNLRSGVELAIVRLPASVEQIYERGGIASLLAHRLAERGIEPPRGGKPSLSSIPVVSKP